MANVGGTCTAGGHQRNGSKGFNDPFNVGEHDRAGSPDALVDGQHHGSSSPDALVDGQHHGSSSSNTLAEYDRPRASDTLEIVQGSPR